MYSGKISNNIKENFQFFSVKERLKISLKIGIFKKFSIKIYMIKRIIKVSIFFINGGTYQDEI